MGERTPTPWVLHAPLYIEPYITAKDMILIATAAGILNESLANAAFIVKAVNSHDALVEALEGLVEAVRRDCDVRDKGISGYTGARLTDAKNILASIKEPA